MRLPVELPDPIRSKLMLEIRSLTQTIREMEDLASKFEIDISSDKLYIAICAYKQALSDLIER
jgi:hypothetical protein